MTRTELTAHLLSQGYAKHAAPENYFEKQFSADGRTDTVRYVCGETHAEKWKTAQNGALVFVHRHPYESFWIDAKGKIQP